MRTKSAQPHRRTAVGSVSWLALVAATTLGAGPADTVRTEVRLPSEATLARRPYRLVVQSYAEPALRDGSLPAATQRPLASVQRAVTREEMERGVRVDLVEFKQAADAARGLMVAWLEPGEPDLEFDGRTARPGRGSFYGLTRAEDDAAAIEIRLDRRVG